MLGLTRRGLETGFKYRASLWPYLRRGGGIPTATFTGLHLLKYQQDVIEPQPLVLWLSSCFLMNLLSIRKYLHALGGVWGLVQRLTFALLFVKHLCLRDPIRVCRAGWQQNSSQFHRFQYQQG